MPAHGERAGIHTTSFQQLKRSFQMTSDARAPPMSLYFEMIPAVESYHRMHRRELTYPQADLLIDRQYYSTCSIGVLETGPNGQ